MISRPRQHRRRNAGHFAALIASATVLLGMASQLVADEPPLPSTAELTRLIEQLKGQVASNPQDDRLTQQLAWAYNAQGVQLTEQGQWDAAVEHFRLAAALRPTDATLERNLVQAMVGAAQTLYNARKTREAKRLLDQALRHSTISYEGWLLAGQLAYESQQLKQAEEYWQRALAARPDAPEAQRRLEQLRRERIVEDQFGKISEQFFELRFDADVHEESDQLRNDLLEVRRALGQAFHYFPMNKIVVLVYTEERFRQLHAGSPEWVGGQYDGKIRIPIRSQDPRELRRILWHEYTHALVHALGLNRCPIWLNEGLAEWAGAMQRPASFALLKTAATASPPRLYTLTQLAATFNDKTTAADTAALAYEQAHSFVSYLINRYGLWRLTRILKQLGRGEELEAAVRGELHAALPMLYKRWWDNVPVQLASP